MSAPAAQVVQPAASEAATEENVPQSTIAETPVQPAPVQVIDAPAAKADPVPVAAEVKPVLPSEPVVSEADRKILAKLVLSSK
ncbi:MAG: hypothetical protein NUV75_00320 [Gallionella sp.]|nr:hypothetical protein [Gallionella sp.]